MIDAETALVLSAAIGAVGGLVYFIVPPAVTECKIGEMLKRLIAGGIVGALMSPALVGVLDAADGELSYPVMVGVAGIMAAGYMAIDVLKSMLKGEFPFR